MPIPGRKTTLLKSSNLERDARRYSAGAQNRRELGAEGDFVTFNASTLQSVHEWMRHAEGKDAYLARPARVEDMLLAAQAEAAEIIH